MKNKQVFAGMLAIMLVFGLILMGCPTPTDGDDEKNPLKGTTWVATGTDNEGAYVITYIFTSDSYQFSYKNDGIETTNESGTYSIFENTVNFTDQDGYTFTGTISNDTLIISNNILYKQ
jgi:uncharacterized lipoprotein NlpE involved in copper resistance